MSAPANIVLVLIRCAVSWDNPALCDLAYWCRVETTWYSLVLGTSTVIWENEANHTWNFSCLGTVPEIPPAWFVACSGRCPDYLTRIMAIMKKYWPIILQSYKSSLMWSPLNPLASQLAVSQYLPRARNPLRNDFCDVRGRFPEITHEIAHKWMLTKEKWTIQIDFKRFQR